jgi:hypothetical protein
VPDLTIDACPTCGLPAEVIDRTESEATARCVLMHDFTIAISAVDVRVPEPVLPPEPVRAAEVLPFRSKVSTKPEWARRMAWFTFGALAALLLLRAPIAAFVLIPLSIPLIAVESARKSWRPLAPLAKAMQLPVEDPAVEDGRQAA